MGQQRYVGRASVRRVVARARPHRRPDAVRGRASRPDTGTRLFRRAEPTDPVFMDASGRRARVVRRVMYWLAALALLLLTVLWLSQAVVVAAVR